MALVELNCSQMTSESQRLCSRQFSVFERRTYYCLSFYFRYARNLGHWSFRPITKLAHVKIGP